MNKKQKAPIVEAGEANFESEVLKSTQPVLVAFCASWSQPCHILSTVIDEVAAECCGWMRVVKVNPDDYPDLSMWYDIQSIPTLLFFINGKLCARFVGTASKEAIIAKLHTLCHDDDVDISNNDIKKADD
jgi:thioredoxin 1